MIDFPLLGEKIRQRRSQRGWNQMEFAARCGVSTRLLQDIEKGRVDLKLSVLTNITKALDINTWQFVDPVIGCRHPSGAAPADSHCPFDELPAGIQICNADGLILYINGPAQNLQGYSRTEVMHRLYLWDLLDDEQEKADLKKYLEYLKRERPRPLPYLSENRRKDGSRVQVRVNWSYITNEADEVVGFFANINRDGPQQGPGRLPEDD